MRKATLAVTTIAALTLFATSCGSSTSSTDTVAPDTTVVLTETTFTVDGAWARTSPMESTVGVVYMNITPSADDALVGASVDMAIAGMTQVHETTTAADGSMGMQEIASIPMTAGTPLALVPGGFHIMLMKLAKPLETGTSIAVTLTFESGATTIVDVPVLTEAP
ncbi:MAG: copper chaperone PCu(A)C [Actinobacteria bacterium]|nr:copper chaperone PCu(A)C [Actinomycetota bacterium]